MLSSLCFPDHSKSCFACCPPIRPAGYDHIDHKNIIKRTLLENTGKYDPEDREIRPITGFSCWALGYTDDNYRQIGCLLHPVLNNGNDLRFRIDYGNKCMREICQEAKIFEMLEQGQKEFWLGLTSCMDSFEYSSRKTNIVFDLLGWGSKVLEAIADREQVRYKDKTDFLVAYPFFKTALLPKSSAWLLTYIVNEKGTEVLKIPEFETVFKGFAQSLQHEIKEQFDMGTGAVHVHMMDMDVLFLDFLRIFIDLKKSEYSTVDKIRQYSDNRLKLFSRGL